MAERVEIIIAAKNQFGKVFKGVQNQVRNFEQGARLNKLDQALGRTQKNFKAVGTQATAAGKAVRAFKQLVLPLVGIGILTGAVRTLAEFEERMDGVLAVTGATVEEMQTLEDTARELGAQTRFSAAEAASGMEFLGRAGFRATEIVDAMAGVLDLAAAGQLGLAEAADIASNVLQGFGEAADQSNRAADILARTAAISNTNVSQLGQAMSFVAPVAAQLGVSMEETAAAIGALSNAGVQGTRAGTSLRKVLSTLAALTPKQKALFESLGVSADRLNVEAINPLTGQTNSLVDVIKALGEANLTTAQNFELFGDRGAIGATVLVEAGRAADDASSSLVSLSKETESAEGTAKNLADVMSDNIPGAFRSLVSAAQEVILQVGEGGLGSAIRGTIDTLIVFTRALGGADQSLDDTLSLAGQLGRAFRILGQTISDVFGSLSLATGEANDGMSVLAGLINGISLGIAGIRDGFTVFTIAISRVAQLIARYVVKPIGLLIKGLGKAASVVNDDLGESLKGIGDTMANLEEAPKIIADELTMQFARGESATKRVLDRISGVNDGLDDTKEKAEEAGEALTDAAEEATNEIADLVANLSLDQIVAGDAAASFDLFKDQVERSLTDLEDQLKDGELSIQAYTEKRLALQEELIDREIAIKEVQRGAVEDATEQAKLAADILILQAQRRDLAAQAITDQAEAEKKLAETLLKVRTELAQLTGQRVPVGDIEASIRQEFEDTIASLKAEGDKAGVELVETLINKEVAAAQFKELEDQAKGAFDRIKVAQEALQKQVELGIISEQQAREQLKLALAENKTEVQNLVPEMQRLAEAVGDPELAARVRQISFEIETVGNVASQSASRINASLEGGLTDFFDSVASGSKSAKDAFLDFGRGVLDTIRKIAAEQLAKSILGSVGGGAGGGLGGLLAGALGFAEGGHVSGPGTSTSDSIPARLSDGEYVVRASAVKRYGAGFFEALNRMSFPSIKAPSVSIPRIPRYAEGGLVKDSGTGGGGGSTSFRIVNVTDPSQVDQFINSPSGERSILNVIRRNSTGVKQVLK